MRDAAGNGVTGAAVVVSRGTAPTPELALRSGADGAFRLALPPGRFTVEAYAGDGRQGVAEVVVADMAVAIDLLLS